MTSDVITLREFDARDVELSARDYTALRARYRGKIELAPTERVGVYRLSTRDYVGRIGLPDRRTLVIEPKVGVANLFYMLCMEAGVAELYSPTIRLRQHPEIFTFVLSAILSETEKLVVKGLYWDYQPLEEALPLVRGRIMLGAQINRYGELKHHHVCRYAHATSDTDENRVVTATLRTLSTVLRLPSEGDMLRRVRDLLPRFVGVGVATRGTAIMLLKRVRKHRLNAAYWPLLRLCGLVLNGVTLHEDAGSHPFPSFLVDMPRLFESFLTRRLRQALPLYKLRGMVQRHDYLDVGRRVGIRPDLLVYDAQGTEPALVLDAKYRRLDAVKARLNSDLYQVSAYMDRYGLGRGMLVYPQWEHPSAEVVNLRGTPKEVHIATLDLAVATPAALDEECDRLAERIAALARGVHQYAKV